MRWFERFNVIELMIAGTIVGVLAIVWFIQVTFSHVPLGDARLTGLHSTCEYGQSGTTVTLTNYDTAPAYVKSVNLIFFKGDGTEYGSDMNVSMTDTMFPTTEIIAPDATISWTLATRIILDGPTFTCTVASFNQ